MRAEDFKQGFKYFTVGYLHEDWHNSFIEKRSSLNRRLYKFNFTITDEHFSLAQEPEELNDDQNVQVFEQ